MFIAAVFMIAKIWKQPKCPLIGDWIKKWWYIYTMEYYTAGILTFWDSMDGTGDYYTKQNKPVGKRQIPYNLTFKRNLMNRIN